MRTCKMHRCQQVPAAGMAACVDGFCIAFECQLPAVHLLVVLIVPVTSDNVKTKKASGEADLVSREQ